MVDASPKLPNHARAKITARKSPFSWRTRALAIIALLALLATDRASAETIRLRIAWGGGEKVAWTGQVELSEGTFSKSHTPVSYTHLTLPTIYSV